MVSFLLTLSCRIVVIFSNHMFIITATIKLYAYMVKLKILKLLTSLLLQYIILFQSIFYFQHLIYNSKCKLATHNLTIDRKA